MVAKICMLNPSGFLCELPANNNVTWSETKKNVTVEKNHEHIYNYLKLASAQLWLTSLRISLEIITTWTEHILFTQVFPYSC